MQRIGAVYALLIAAFLLPSISYAAAPPTSADPSRVWERLEPLRPAPAPFTPAPKAAAPKPVVPEGAESITFTLTAVGITGMTVYTAEDIAPLFKDMIDKQVSFADLYTLAAAITAKYRNDGYILSQVIVPPQEIADGRVALRAVEGFIDNIAIKGESGAAPEKLLPYLAIIKSSRPLNNRDLERATLLANDLPGITAEAVLSPSPSTPGAANLTLVVKRKAIEGYAAIDNRGSRFMGPLGANAGVTINNALGLFESISVQLGGTAERFSRRELASAGITWSGPVNTKGTRLNISGNISETRPGFTIASFENQGISRNASIEIMHPVLRSRRKNISVNAKFDWLDSQRSDNLGGPATIDKLRVLRLGAMAQFADPLGGATTLSTEISKGLGLFNATRKGEANISRTDGDPQFFKGTFNLSRVQPIFNTWQLYTALSGQKSATLLLAGEEFGLGGAQFGSAYEGSELTGEDGIAFRGEMQRSIPLPPLAAVQGYMFYDIGKIWNPDDAAVASRALSLASAGGGFRAQLNENFSATLEIAKPLTRNVSITGNRKPRGFFSLTAQF